VLRNKLGNVRSLAPFGINYVVNARTFSELDAATAFASDVGATEFLLLPERPTRRGGGIDNSTVLSLSRWVSIYRGTVPLTVSEAGADGLPTCNPLIREAGLRAYAHIDATGVLKRSSFDIHGVAIGTGGVIGAINILKTLQKETP